jgi:PKD repeat protein
VYWSYSPFTAATDAGVKQVQWLEDTTRLVLTVQQNRITWIGISAVDLNGNESSISDVESIKRASGSVPAVQIDTTSVSVMKGDSASIMASGASSYDFDTDGDGDFDITGDTTGTAAVDTSATGIIRPRVRASDGGGTAVAYGSVSLIVSGNQRPVASAQVSPSFGYAPLAVTFTGGGTDFDGTIAEYAWDRTGDGIYEKLTQDTSGNFSVPGLYNAKLRVTDDDGDWDVDTVSVQVVDTDVQITFQPGTVSANESITLTAQSKRPVTHYEWDLDGDAAFETDGGTEPSIQTYFDSAGPHWVNVRVTFVEGDSKEASLYLDIRGWHHTPAVDGSILEPSESFSLLSVDNRPFVIMSSLTDQQIYYIAAADEAGLTWEDPVAIPDAVTQSGAAWRVPSRIVAGKPAFCFTDSFGNLMFVRATTADGISWGAPVVASVNNGSSDHLSCSMAVVGGLPAVATISGASVEYVQATTASGSLWGTPVNFGSNAVGNICLAEVTGHPAVIYESYPIPANVNYCRASDAEGTTWTTFITFDAGDDSGYDCNFLSVIDGHPAVLYENATRGEIRYRRAFDADGTSWFGQMLKLADDGVSNSYKLAVYNGLPIVVGNRDGALFCASGIDPQGHAFNTELIGYVPSALSGDGAYTEAAGRPATMAYDADNHTLEYFVRY